MKLSGRSQLLLTVLSYNVLQAIAYQYAELQKWNASCFPRDTCSTPRDLDDPHDHNCDCSSICALYDSCCIDSPFLNITNTYKRESSCRPTGQSGEYVFMIASCPGSYQGPLDIRRRCEQDVEDWSDPFNNVPVTNLLSQKTYKSLFCAICNGEHVRQLTFWQILLDCSTLKDSMKLCTEDKDFVLDNMVYIREKDLWGMLSNDPESDWKFRVLSINFRIPESIRDFVRGCRPNLVSECDETWKDQKTRQLCKAYMGVVYFKGVAYRNVHCAVCNYETNFPEMSCHQGVITFKGNQMNFGILLDIDLTDGTKVGLVESKCNSDQVYDPFAKKCRNLECPLPGYNLINGKCSRD